MIPAIGGSGRLHLPWTAVSSLKQENRHQALNLNNDVNHDTNKLRVVTFDDLPGSLIPTPKLPKGTPAGTLTGTCEGGLGSSEGMCIRERGSVGGLTRGFLTEMRDL